MGEVGGEDNMKTEKTYPLCKREDRWGWVRSSYHISYYVPCSNKLDNDNYMKEAKRLAIHVKYCTK